MNNLTRYLLFIGVVFLLNLFKLDNVFSNEQLADNEKGLFGWVYDIMIIEPGNLVKQIRVDAGTSTILSVVTGGK